MWGLEQFEKESIRAFQKLKRGHKFRYEVHALEVVKEALSKKW